MIAGQHLLDIGHLSREQICGILGVADGFFEISKRRIKKVPTLRGRTILNLFFEPSTRTRVSFELAEKRLSADGVNIAASGSSVSKGETLLDTARTLDAMQADAVVVRHGSSGVPGYLARHLKARVINAGDGMCGHPTQALLDAYTMRQHHRSFEGLEVAMVGDIAHSRVARSNLRLLQIMGAKVRVFGPATLVPPDLAALYGCQVVRSLREAVSGAQVVMALRLQRERMVAGLLPNLHEYAEVYGIDARAMAWADKDAILMHPGPVNRGVEVSSELVDGVSSVVLDQVENGVAVRAAILYLILGGEASEPAAG